ncbi:MAG: hypothetical protein J6Y02_13165 [Pseudobutyrivibrio sp.]|nr:hypothetical protein [Pseudobutyrivibrio sp.]
MDYVVHYCKNKDGLPGEPEPCNNAWIDEDLTNVQTVPPQWKYCRECCKKLNIDFEKQKPRGHFKKS